MESAKRLKVGVLFVHGIVGNRRFFDFLLPAVPEQWKSINLTLDGHGGDALAFSKTSMAKWKRQVDDAVERLKTECDKVVIVAHSMGTLFALDQSARRRASALFLLNPPMKIRLTRRLFVNSFKVMSGLTSDPVASAARDAYGISIDYNPLHYYGWPRRYLELFAEIRRVRRLVNNVECKGQVFIAGRDEMVSPSTVTIFSTKKNFQTQMLNESGHYYYTPADRELIVSEFSRLMNDIMSEN